MPRMTAKERAAIEAAQRERERTAEAQRRADREAELARQGLWADLDAARAFFSALGLAETVHQFRVIPERPGQEDHAKTFSGTFDRVADRLEAHNRRGYGVFVSTQHLVGGGKAENLSALRCCWLDFDARHGQRLPARWKVPPSAVVETSPGSFHVWWAFRKPHKPTEEARTMWAGVQRRLVQTYDSDPSGHASPAKILRVPGFMRWKDGQPNRVCAHLPNVPRRDLGELARVYTPIRPKASASGRHATNRQATAADMLMLRSALRCIPPSVAGNRGGYELWLQIGMALHHGTDGSADGLALWHEWARSSPFYVSADLDQKWRSFARVTGPVLGLGTVFHIAKQHGWKRPHIPFRSAFLLNQAEAKQQA